MKRIHSLAVFAVFIFLSACAGGSFQTGGNVAQGRQALFAGSYPAALADFQAAAQQDPNYIYGSLLQEGVWSYVGRTQYLLGQYPQAQQTLTKALTQRKSNDVVNLYLGLTLIRLGDRDKGRGNMEIGMKGIAAFINYITQQYRYEIGQYWDPGHAIRNAIQNALVIAASPNVDWQQLLTQGEWIGINFEQEPDRANAQQIQDRTMNMQP
jgi:tetratricopeptide (TPR) repeat protein